RPCRVRRAVLGACGAAVPVRPAGPRPPAPPGAVRVRLLPGDLQAGRQAPLGVLRTAGPVRRPAGGQARRHRRPPGRGAPGQRGPPGRGRRGGHGRRGGARDQGPGRLARAGPRPELLAGVALRLVAPHGAQPLGARLGRQLVLADGAVHRLQVGGVQHGQRAVLLGPLERPSLVGQDLADGLLAGVDGVVAGVSGAASGRGEASHWRILTWAWGLLTKPSHSLDGPGYSALEVRISTTSPSARTLARGTSWPLTRAPMQWWPSSVRSAWAMSPRVAARRAAGGARLGG